MYEYSTCSKQPRKGRRDVEQVKKDLKVICSDEEIEIGHTCTVYALANEKLCPMYMYINGACVHFELDTEASMILTTCKMLDEFWPNEK